jgi:hypothetical protein
MRWYEKTWAVLVVGLGIVLGIFATRGLPLPHYDDMAFVGVAINLAREGTLENPFIADWQAHFFGTTKSYWYVPGYFYLLAFWLKIAGISTLSLLAFQWLFYAIGAVAFGALVRKYAVPEAICVLCALIVPWVLLRGGLRPDATGFALLFSGLAVLDFSRLWKTLAGFLLVAGAALVCPHVIIPFVPLVWAEFVRQQSCPPALPAGCEEQTARFASGDAPADILREEGLPDTVLEKKPAARPGEQMIGNAINAGVVAALFGVLALWGMVRGDLSAFAEVFNAHRAMRLEANPFWNLVTFVAKLTFDYEPFQSLLVFLVFAVVYWEVRRDDGLFPPRARLLLLGLFRALLCFAAFSPAWAKHFMDLFQWPGVLIYCSRQFPLSRQTAAFVIGLALISQGFYTLENFGRVAPQESLKKLHASFDPRLPVVFDASSARFVFDYQLQPSARYYNYLVDSRSFPGESSRRQTIWVLNRVYGGKAIWFTEKTWSSHLEPFQPLQALGITFNLIPRSLYEPLVITY